VQEGLINVFKHSGSQSATVVLENNEGLVRLQITDYGRGMPDESALASIPTPPGVGIAIVRERLRRWGGRLTIESNSEGVLLVAEVPVNLSIAASAKSGS
jgi:signal transduction histidine kinase